MRKGRKSIEFSFQQLEEMESMYTEGKTFKQVAEKFNVSESTIYSRLKEKVTPRQRSLPSRDVKLLAQKFESPLSNDTLKILAIIKDVGNIATGFSYTKDCYRVRLTASIEKKKLLESCCNFLDIDSSKLKQTSKNRITVDIYNKELCLRLIELGVKKIS